MHSNLARRVEFQFSTIQPTEPAIKTPKMDSFGKKPYPTRRCTLETGKLASNARNAFPANLPGHFGNTIEREVPRSEDCRIRPDVEPDGDVLASRRVLLHRLPGTGCRVPIDHRPASAARIGYKVEHRPKPRDRRDLG